MARVKQLTSPSSGSQDKVYGTDWNAIRLDYISMSGTVLAQTVARLDHIKFNPISAPAAVEGRVYYDSTAKRLKLRDNAEWLTIPGAGGTGAFSEPHQWEDYLVFLESGTWKARNGNTAVIDYSNANPRIVINQALAAVGGSVSPQGLVVVRGSV